MRYRWRIVNPALNPPQVGFETEDEQAALREFAARDGSRHGLSLLKSEDGGTIWLRVEARAPDAVAEKSDGDSTDKPKAEGSKKTPK